MSLSMTQETETRETKRPGQYNMAEFFERLHEKGIRAEDVASDLRRSFSWVQNLKKGRTQPDFVVVQYMERRYGLKIHSKVA